MYTGGVGEDTNTFKGVLPWNQINCFGNGQLRLSPIKQENQSHPIECSRSTINLHRRAQSNLIVSMLQVLEIKFSKCLEKCREEIRVVQEHIVLCKKEVQCCTETVSRSRCTDYNFLRQFRTFSNADTLMKEANQELRLTDLNHISRKWTKFHKRKLEEAIIAMETESRIIKAAQKEENLQKALEESEDPKRKAEIESKMRTCESLDEIFKMTPKNLCADVRKEYDWLSISSNAFKGRFSPKECRSMWHTFLHPKINKKRWTEDEILRLKELATTHRYEDWDKIAWELGTGRSALQCIVNYYDCRPTFFEGSWSKHENRVLKNAVKHLAVGSNIPWHVVASYLPGRNKKQVWDHWTNTMNPLIKKGIFTREEDMLLVAAVRKYGKKFDKVAQVFHNRTSAQLRHRYTLILEQPKEGVPWTPQDDELLLQIVKKYGEGKWKEISDHFLYYDRVQVRHHYNVLKKRKLSDTSSEDECVTEECEDWISEHNLIAEASNLVYGTSSNVDGVKRRKLERMLLPIRKRESIRPLSGNFKVVCYNHFKFMQSNPYSREMRIFPDNEQVERKFHLVSCVLYIIQARLLIPGYNNPLLNHHLLSETDREVISLLRDRHLVTEKEAASGLLTCKTESDNGKEPAAVYCQYIPTLSETHSAYSDSVILTMPINHTTLMGFQSLSSHCEFLKKRVYPDESHPEDSAHSLLEQRLFCFFFWPILASGIEPEFTNRETVVEKPKERRRYHPSRAKKRRYLWLRKEKEKKVDEPQTMKRKYVKSGKYKKEHSTETSKIRRSSRIASTSVQC